MTMTSGTENTGSGHEKKEDNNDISKLFEYIKSLEKKIEGFEKNQSEQSKAANSAISSNPGLTGQDILNIIKEARTNEKDIDYSAGIKEEQIPLDDYDEKGVRFCCPRVGYVLIDDIRKGHRVVLPYGKEVIVFKHASTRKVMAGKHSNLFTISVYRSHSKKEIEWIKNHTLFNIMFYESATDASKVDNMKVVRMASVMNSLKNYEFHQLLQTCKSYNVTPSEDANDMKARLTAAIIDKEFQHEKEVTRKILSGEELLPTQK